MPIQHLRKGREALKQRRQLAYERVLHAAYDKSRAKRIGYPREKWMAWRLAHLEYLTTKFGMRA